jgi:hypothetical protein
MKFRRYILGAAAATMAALALSAVSAIAHHSNAPFYDTSKKIEMQGKIMKFVFMNPHAFLYVDAVDGSGTTIQWQVELGAPISLRRTGWTPDTMKIGTEIKVSGSPSKAEGTYGMCCARITRLDGTPITPGGREQEESVPR